MPKHKSLINPDTKVLLKQIFIGLLVFGVVAMILAGIWHGTRVQSLTLDQVKVNGGETIKHDMIEGIVREKLTGQYLGLIPKTFAWFYPQEAIISSLSAVERIKHLSVERVSGKELLISFDEYVPHALWCDYDNEEQCLFLDEEGYAFGQAPVLSGGSFLRFNQTGKPSSVREKVVSKEVYDLLLQFEDSLAKENWFVSTIEIGQAEDAFLKVIEGGEFKITLTQSVEETIENLFIILNSEEYQHIEPGNFNYIDLRYGNKVFVNEELAVPEEETASSTVES